MRSTCSMRPVHEAAVLVGWSRGGKWAAYTAALHPDRALGAVLLAPGIPFTQHPYITAARFTGVHEPAEGWDKFSLAHWRADWADFVHFFHEQVFPEPHSSKQREDATGWSLETDPGRSRSRWHPGWRGLSTPRRSSPACDVPCWSCTRKATASTPTSGVCAPPSSPGATCSRSQGRPRPPATRAGVRQPCPARLRHPRHPPRARAGAQPRSRWVRGLDRRPRVLYLSSPIGLGHVRRDLAIARQLAARVDGLAIDWLTQPPVTGVLEAAGHQVHPASRWLASESAHLTDESGEHDLHVFEAFRRMDELMVANFHVFQEVVETGATTSSSRTKRGTWTCSGTTTPSSSGPRWPG
jgi:pimeloyl-ACP methyl ester carboxylesterase